MTTPPRKPRPRAATAAAQSPRRQTAAKPRPRATTAQPRTRATTSSPKPAPVGARLSDAEMSELLQLLHASDTVELKVTVPAETHLATIRGLPLDPIEALTRQVFFFDTPDLALDKAGVVVRARRSQGGRGDTVVKLRPVVPDKMSAELRKLPSFNIEVDVLPGGFVCSASFKGRTTVDEVRQVARGSLRLSKLFGREQRAFYAEHAPAGITMDSLSVLGPTFALKWKFDADVSKFGRAKTQRMVAELWLYPDGSRILELSLRCLISEAFQVAAEARAYLTGRDIELGGEQQPKTRTALQFYAGQLSAGSG